MYQALTANSLQFGSRIDLYASYAGAIVDGNLSFDALIYFDPFSFIVSMRANVIISYSGERLASVRLLLDLSGPTPWHARGEASFEILFWTISVDFDESWGPRKITRLAPVNPWVPLEQALQRDEGWSSSLERVKPDESFMPISGGTPLLLHPNGGFEITENVLPLEVTLELLGHSPVSDYNRFELNSISVDGQPLSTQDWSHIEEHFARGQYENLTDNQKLTIPSFEKMAGGVKVKPNSLLIPNTLAHKELSYESILIDDKDLRLKTISAGIPWFVAHSQLAGNMMNKTITEKVNRYANRNNLNKVGVDEETFLIVDRETLEPVASLNTKGAVNRIKADQQLAQINFQNGQDAQRYMVVSSFETEAA
jgi:hypothetical protein